MLMMMIDNEMEYKHRRATAKREIRKDIAILVIMYTIFTM